MATDYLKWADRNWGLLTKLMGGHAKIYRATHGDRPPRAGCAGDAVARPQGRQERHATHNPAGVRPRWREQILIASKGGYPKNPPGTTTSRPTPTDDPDRLENDRRARPRGDADEYDRMWKLAVDVYSGYEAYRRRTERKIPLIVLDPR